MQTIPIDPVVASIYIVSDEPINGNVRHVNNASVKNITNNKILDLIPHIRATFCAKTTSLSEGVVVGDYSQAEVRALNSNRELNFLVDATIVLNFSNSDVYVKVNSNLAKRVPPIPLKLKETKDIHTNSEDMIYVIKMHTLPNSYLRKTPDVQDYLRELQKKYITDRRSASSAVCAESEAIVNFLIEHQHELTNFRSEDKASTPAGNLQYYVNALVAYPIPASTLMEEKDKTIIIYKTNVMLSAKDMVNMPEHGPHISNSYIKRDMDANPNSPDYVNPDGSVNMKGKHLLYYNDYSNTFTQLFYNHAGVVCTLPNIKDVNQAQCVFLESWDPETNLIHPREISFDSIKNGTNLYITDNRTSAEKKLDPSKHIEAIKSENEARKAVIEGENIELRKTLDQLQHRHKLEIEEIEKTKSQRDFAGYVLKSDLDREKNAGELKLQQTKNLWMGVSVATAALGVASTIAGLVFGKKS